MLVTIAGVLHCATPVTPLLASDSPLTKPVMEAVKLGFAPP